MGRDDDHDDLDDVLDQVDAALDALDLGDNDTRAALLDGVKDALLQALDALPDGLAASPEVVLLDGGGDDAGPSDGPQLRVVGDDEEASDGPEGFTEVAPGEWVKVLSLDDLSIRPRRNRGHDDGHIRLDEDAWQTVFRGTEPRAYRIACTEGLLQVAMDGQLVEQVHPGQTLDVEAALLRVHATEPTEGTYRRL